MNEKIVQHIKKNIDPQAQVILEGNDCNLQVTVISNVFSAKSILTRHRMINDLFKADILSGQLHALSIKTYTPEEYTP